SRIADGAVDPALAKVVLDATFWRYLTKPCPEIPEVAGASSWVELDRIKSKANAAGLMRPQIVQRAAGHFTTAEVNETLFAIEVGSCVGNGSNDLVYVVFETADFDAPTPLKP